MPVGRERVEARDGRRVVVALSSKRGEGCPVEDACPDFGRECICGHATSRRKENAIAMTGVIQLQRESAKRKELCPFHYEVM